MNARLALLGAGLAYAIWEAVDIFWIDVPAAAAVFAALFLCSVAWFWRRDSRVAAVALLALCAFEAGIAPTLHADSATKAFDVALGAAGVVSAIAVIARRGRRALVT